MTRQSKLLLQISFIGTFAESMITPFWTIITQRVHGTIFEAGIGFALFQIVTGLVVLMVGRTAWFHVHRKLLVFVGFSIAGVGDILYVLVSNVYELYANQILIGLSMGLLGPAWDSLYSDDIEEGQGGKQWSLWTGGINFIMGAATLLAGGIITWLGFNYLFVFMAISNSVAIWYAYKIYRD